MKEKNGEHPFGDSGQMILLFVFLIVWILDSFLLHRSTMLAGSVPLAARLVLLAVFMVTAAALIRAGHRAVGHDGHSMDVIRSGAFRFVRHPLYLGSMLIYIGLAVATVSLGALVICIAIFLFYNYIAGYEEHLLLSKTGDEYRKYREQTGKWIPRIGRGRAD